MSRSYRDWLSKADKTERKTAYNNSVATAYELIENNPTVAIPAAAFLDVRQSGGNEAGDSGASAVGARQIKITYIDTNWAQQTTFVNLVGGSPAHQITPVGGIKYIEKVEVSQVGASGTNLANIYIGESGAAANWSTGTYAMINALEGKEQKCIHYVPSGAMAYVTGWNAWAGSAAAGVISTAGLFIDNLGSGTPGFGSGVETLVDHRETVNGGIDHHPQADMLAIRVPAGCRIQLKGKVSNGTDGQIGGNIDYWQDTEV